MSAELRDRVAEVVLSECHQEPVAVRVADAALVGLLAAKPYVCENCGRLGVLSSFNDDCRPGWTHGRLIAVKAVQK